MCDVLLVSSRKDKGDGLDGELMGLIEDQVRDFDALPVRWDEADTPRRHLFHAQPSMVNTTHATKSRRRPRLELLELRETVLRLQQQLDALRHDWRLQVMRKSSLVADAVHAPTTARRDAPRLPGHLPMEHGPPGHAQSCSWKEIAEQELLARHASEQINDRLRQLVQYQVDLSRQVLGLSSTGTTESSANTNAQVNPVLSSRDQQNPNSVTSFFRRLEHSSGARMDPQVFVDGEFAELTGSAESFLDASTLVDLVWRCFVSMAGSSAADGAPNEAIHDEPTKDQRPGHGHSNAQMPWVIDGILHINAQFLTNLSPSQQLYVDGHNAMKKLSNGVLWELTGTMSVPSYQEQQQVHGQDDDVLLEALPMPFVRSVWCCVEPSTNGNNVVHHGVRIKPLWPTSNPECEMLHPTEQTNSTTGVTNTINNKVQYRRQLALLVQWMHQCRAETAERFLQFLEQDL